MGMLLHHLHELSAYIYCTCIVWWISKVFPLRRQIRFSASAEQSHLTSLMVYVIPPYLFQHYSSLSFNTTSPPAVLYLATVSHSERLELLIEEETTTTSKPPPREMIKMILLRSTQHQTERLTTANRMRTSANSGGGLSILFIPARRRERQPREQHHRHQEHRCPGSVRWEVLPGRAVLVEHQLLVPL